MLHILSEVFGGLGLFFVGINILSENIKKLGSGYTPAIIRVFSKGDLACAIGGLFSGIATSSGKAVTFSLVALSELGQLDVRTCLPIVVGGSVGSAFIVLWASIDFQLFIFVLMGVSGVLYQFGNQKNEKLKLLTGIALGFSLLFYGLESIKLGAAPFKELPWFNDYLQASQGRWFIALVIGATLSFLSQSGSSVAIIAISLVNANMLGFDEAVMLVFGTNLGSGISTALLGLGLNGVGRQLVLFHGFFKIIGIVVMVPILALEVYGGIPLVKEFVYRVSSSASTQIAIIYLLYEIITGLVIAGYFPQLARFFERADARGLVEPDVKNTDNFCTRIALAHPEGADVTDLVRTLENEGIVVAALHNFNADWRTLIRQSGVKALLVELGNDIEHNFPSLENLLEEATIPVFFNEHHEAKDSEFSQNMIGKNLLAKLILLGQHPLEVNQAAA